MGLIAGVVWIGVAEVEEILVELVVTMLRVEDWLVLMVLSVEDWLVVRITTLDVLDVPDTIDALDVLADAVPMYKRQQ